MERKKLIRPITILKTKNYLRAVYEHVIKGEPFSLDKLAREYQISGSSGTALVRNNWLLETDVKGKYQLMDENHDYLLATDTNAKKLIEQVRLLNDSARTQKDNNSRGIAYDSDGNDVHLKDYSKNEHEPVIPKKDFKTSEINELIKAIKGVKETQLNIFGDTEKKDEDLLKIVCAIASGSYNSLSIWNEDEIPNINNRIIYAASDLFNKLQYFKSSPNK